MEIKELSPRIRVAGQISLTDVGVAAAQGIKTIICNRPDEETPEHPASDTLASAARQVGIEFLYMPVVSGGIKDEDVAKFSTAYKNVNAPILAYCRSGMRSTSLWALMEADSMTPEVIMASAAKAGHDLAALRPRIEARAACRQR